MTAAERCTGFILYTLYTDEEEQAIKRYEISDPEKQMPRPLGWGLVGRCDEAAN
jgi:hypothetical protein